VLMGKFEVLDEGLH